MKYTNAKTGDWVELQGCADLPMRKLDMLYSATTQQAFDVAKTLVVDWRMSSSDGETPVGDMMGLTLKQWDWLREQIVIAARDETLDPEA